MEKSDFILYARLQFTIWNTGEQYTSVDYYNFKLGLKDFIVLINLNKPNQIKLFH